MINKNILHNCHKEGFNEKELYGAYKIFFGTLFSKSRLRIINSLIIKRKNVSEIVKELNIDQTSVSHDLNRLKKCGFVEVERVKRNCGVAVPTPRALSVSFQTKLDEPANVLPELN